MTSNAARRDLEAQRRQKAKAAAAAASAAQGRRRLLHRLAVGSGVTLVVAAMIAVGALTGKDPRSAEHAGHDMAAMNDHAGHNSAAAGAGQTMPPWPAPADAAGLARKAGIAPAAMEGTAEHYHASLRVIVDGTPVPVAPGIGVDAAAGLMSPLHTHETDGTIHVESPEVGRTFTLGQLFLEWDVALSSKRLGALTADDAHPLTLTVNGSRVPGNPADHVIAADEKIELRYGA